MVTSANKKNSAKANGTTTTTEKEPVSAIDFCKSWKSAAAANQTLDQLAAQLHLTKSAVSARASQYKKLGVKFPALKRLGKGSKINADELNAIFA